MSEKIFYTIREVAKTGIMSEYCLRKLVKQGLVPCLYSGSKCLINLQMLKNLIDDKNSAIYEGKGR